MATGEVVSLEDAAIKRALKRKNMGSKSVKIIDCDYAPRIQFENYHYREKRWGVIVAHRRAGKTVALINDLIKDAMQCKMPYPQVAFIQPYQNQVRRTAWQYVKTFTRPFAIAKPNESLMTVNLVNGATFMLLGSDNAESLRGLYLDSVVMDEYGSMKPRIFPGIIRPALADRMGRASFAGTPNGMNEFWDRRQDALEDPDRYEYLELKASETGLLSAEELADARKDMTDAEYQREFECSFNAAHAGSIYGTEIDEAEKAGRMGVFPPVRGVPVHWVMDIGYSDNTAIWGFQEPAGQDIRVVKYYENNQRKLSHYIEWLFEQRDVHGMTPGELWLPHDARNTTWQTGKSSREHFMSAGFNPQFVPELEVWDGIRASREMFRHLNFDKHGCKDGLACLMSYHRKWDEDRKCFIDKPVHDWSSDGADAFRYLCLVAQKKARKLSATELAPRPTRQVKLAELFEDEAFTRRERI